MLKLTVAGRVKTEEGLRLLLKVVMTEPEAVKKVSSFRNKPYTIHEMIVEPWLGTVCL